MDFDPNVTAGYYGGYAIVYSIALQADGNILIGGYFTAVGGVREKTSPGLQTPMPLRLKPIP